MRRSNIVHEFVEYVPKELKEGVLYVSIPFATVVHSCCCGCGNEIVTPLSPTDWRLICDGQSVSLDPSIGNWSLDCQSHYWIKRNAVRWAPSWSRRQIEETRARDRIAKEEFFAGGNEEIQPQTNTSTGRSETTAREESIWRKLRRWWSH